MQHHECGHLQFQRLLAAPLLQAVVQHRVLDLGGKRVFLFLSLGLGLFLLFLFGGFLGGSVVLVLLGEEQFGACLQIVRSAEPFHLHLEQQVVVELRCLQQFVERSLQALCNFLVVHLHQAFAGHFGQHIEFASEIACRLVDTFL